MMPVNVHGHADAAEASRGRSILGERRARAVAEWLIAAGIPRELVAPIDHGASQFLVPTEPGKAERQNRRVEIDPRG
jgi:outer membrane protein OmpA-like peptidoglycan-associated protein